LRWALSAVVCRDGEDECRMVSNDRCFMPRWEADAPGHVGISSCNFLPTESPTKCKKSSRDYLGNGLLCL
jgi:hypothetical protein